MAPSTVPSSTFATPAGSPAVPPREGRSNGTCTSMMEDALAMIPDDFRCCITKRIMSDPVTLPDGYTYERNAVEAWAAAGRNISPKTGQPLSSMTVVPNEALQRAIASFLEEMPHLRSQVYEPFSKEAAEERRRQRIKEAFDIFDTNSTGTLNPQKLYAGMKELGFDSTEGQAVKMIDNDNGEVDFEEFLAMMVDTMQLETADDHLRVWIVARERDLQWETVENNDTVPRLEHETLVLRLERAERELRAVREANAAFESRGSQKISREASSSTACNANSTHDACEIITEQSLAELRRRRAAAEVINSQVESETASLDERVVVYAKAVLRSKGEAERYDQEALSWHNRADLIHEKTVAKKAERDAQGSEFVKLAAQLGLDNPLVSLEGVRKDPRSPKWSGLLLKYAELHLELLALQEDRKAAIVSASVAEESAEHVREDADCTRPRMEAAQHRLTELQSDQEVVVKEILFLAEAIEKLEKNAVECARAAASWAHDTSTGLINAASSDIPMIVLMHSMHKRLDGMHKRLERMNQAQVAQQHRSYEMQQSIVELQKAYATQRSADCQRLLGCLTEGDLLQRNRAAFLALCAERRIPSQRMQAKDTNRGSASVLLRFGYSLRELSDVGYTVGELMGAGIAVSTFKSECFEAQLLTEHFTAADLLAGGYSAGEVREAGFCLKELKSAGYTLADLAGSGCSARTLVDAGFNVNEVLDAIGLPISLDPGVIRKTVVFRDFNESRSRNERLGSQELRFGTPCAKHRYCFQALVYSNGLDEDHRGCVSLYFRPRAGPDADSLAWPIRHTIAMRIVSSGGSRHWEKKLCPRTDEGCRAFFAVHAPPAPDNQESRGWPNFVDASQCQSGKYLIGGDMLVVHFDLLPLL